MKSLIRVETISSKICEGDVKEISEVEEKEIRDVFDLGIRNLDRFSMEKNGRVVYFNTANIETIEIIKFTEKEWEQYLLLKEIERLDVEE